MKPKKPSNWRPFYDTLTAAQKDAMLVKILERYEEIGMDAEVQFREACDDPEFGYPSDFFWESCGDSLLIPDDSSDEITPEWLESIGGKRTASDECEFLPPENDGDVTVSLRVIFRSWGGLECVLKEWMSGRCIEVPGQYRTRGDLLALLRGLQITPTTASS